MPEKSTGGPCPIGPGLRAGHCPARTSAGLGRPQGPIRAEVLLRLGEAVHVGYEDHRRAAAMLSETAEQDGVAPGLASRIPNSLAWAQAATSLHQEGILAETVDLAERAGDEAALASALAHLAALRMWLGQGIDRRAFARAIALKGPLETHVAHADALADVGELAEAERMFNELLRLATEHGDEGSVGRCPAGPIRRFGSRGRRTSRGSARGRCPGARELAEAGLNSEAANSDPSMSITSLGALGIPGAFPG